jgi:hypothetical protein
MFETRIEQHSTSLTLVLNPHADPIGYQAAIELLNARDSVPRSDSSKSVLPAGYAVAGGDRAESECRHP